MKPKLVTTPLRYPGGKSKAITPITNLLGANFTEYREPFVGGGSIFIYLKQTLPHLKIWINDLNPEVYHFWKIAQSNNAELVAAVQSHKKTTDGKALYLELANSNPSTISSFDRAVRFFVLNRISYAGAVDCSRYSPTAFSDRFTISAIDRLAAIGSILDGIKITNLDYSELIKSPGENVAIFADPPYLKASTSKLYGAKGNLHTNFDHTHFAQTMQSCIHQWLVTYDNSDQIRTNFAGFNITDWNLQYSMTSKVKRTVGKELFVQRI